MQSRSAYRWSCLICSARSQGPPARHAQDAILRLGWGIRRPSSTYNQFESRQRPRTQRKVTQHEDSGETTRIARPNRRLPIRKHYVADERLDPDRPARSRQRDNHTREAERKAFERDPRSTMRNVVERKLDEMLSKLSDPHFLASTGLDAESGRQVFLEFESDIRDRMDNWPKVPFQDAMFQKIWEARMESTIKFNNLMRFWLQHHVVSRKLAGRPKVVQHLKELSDMREPFEWYPDARKIRRKIHLHIGPTNSGKTYHALKCLEKADSGLYAGPLRLLAHEVYNRMNAAGQACILKTGDERLENWCPAKDRTKPLISCTVEMTPLQDIYDVAVIDEIQMLADQERGFAWSTALLGLPAREIHLCGEERVEQLIRKIAQLLGDHLEVHRYNRLTPLKTQTNSLNGFWDDLRAGDCVVAFEVKVLHALRAHIENVTKKKVAIVYGSLPPEVRAQQAALFNDPDSGYDFLVASDAIGMGLNLNIKRVVFYTTTKRQPDGKIYPIETSHLKQIAGRAGRFKVAPAGNASAAKASSLDVPDAPTSSATDGIVASSRLASEEPKPTPGLVTTLLPADHESLQRAMNERVPSITTAYLQPSMEKLLLFASLLPPNTPFSYILARFTATAQLHPFFLSSGWKDAIAVADVLQKIPGLSLKDRFIFGIAPTSVSGKAEMIPITRELAHLVAESKPIRVLELKSLNLELLDRDRPATLFYVQELEILHRSITLFNWLSYRYEQLFELRETAFHIRSLVEKRIDQALLELGVEFRGRLTQTIKRRQKDEHRGSAEETPHKTSEISPENALSPHSPPKLAPNQQPSSKQHEQFASTVQEPSLVQTSA